MSGKERRYYRAREELLRFLHIHYIRVFDEKTGRSVVRSLNFRNWEVRLEGSILNFGRSSAKKMLSVAGLMDKPREAAGLILGLVWKEGDENLQENFTDYARGVIEGLAEKEGVTPEDIDGVICDTVYWLKESGVSWQGAAAILESQFDMNGESGRIIQSVYWPEGERVR